MELSLARCGNSAADLARKMDAATNAAAADAPLDLRVKFLHRLATRVGTLGVRLSNLGRREQALAAAQEAVDITKAPRANATRRFPSQSREEPQ